MDISEPIISSSSNRISIVRIAFVVTAQTHEGPLKVVKSLIEGLTERRHECTLLYLEEREEIVLPCRKQKVGYRHQPDLSQYDIVHSHGMKPDFWVWLYLVRNSRRRSKTRFISTYHSFIFEDFRWKYGYVGGWLLAHLFLTFTNRHDKIVVLSDVAKAYYSQWVPQEKLFRCYHGLPMPQRAEHREPDESGDIIVGMCCPLERIKGVDVLLAAMEYMPKNYRLLVVGDGSQRQQLERSAMSGKRVTFVGDVLNPKDYYQQMDVFVVASYSEGFCLSLLEAAQMGMSVVCSDIPGMREKFSEEEVTYFKTGDARDLARAVQDAMLQQKGERAREKALTFSVERMCESHERVYGGIVSHR